MTLAGGDFLLPNATFFPELLVFLVIVGVIAKKVVPPLNRAMLARQQHIAESLEVIETAKRIQSDTDAAVAAELDEARALARETVDNAHRLAEQIEAEARRTGEEEYARLVGRAQAEIDRSRAQAEAAVISQLAELVVATAERVIEAEIDPARHRALIDQTLSAVAASPDSGPAGA